MCTNLKTLIIQWAAPDIRPAEGYVIKYRPVGTTNWETFLVPNPAATNAAVPNVPACTSVEVSIQTKCGTNSFGFETTTVVSGGCTCRQYELANNTGGSISYSYFSCEGIQIQGTLANNQEAYFSADTRFGAIISGGAVLTPGSCA